MRYAVTYLAGGEERTVRLDAADAAAAAAASEAVYAGPTARYELLRVRLLDAPEVLTRRADGCGDEAHDT